MARKRVRSPDANESGGVRQRRVEEQSVYVVSPHLEEAVFLHSEPTEVVVHEDDSPGPRGKSGASAEDPTRPFACDVEGCGKRFAEEHQLAEHQQTHVPKKNQEGFRCNTLMGSITTKRQNMGKESIAQRVTSTGAQDGTCEKKAAELANVDEAFHPQPRNKDEQDNSASPGEEASLSDVEDAQKKLEHKNSPSRSPSPLRSEEHLDYDNFQLADDDPNRPSHGLEHGSLPPLFGIEEHHDETANPYLAIGRSRGRSRRVLGEPPAQEKRRRGRNLADMLERFSLS
ncbi:hypothetical protein T439DRAFT_383802 [Meredithblackwellia eburnea MCA 4105]